MAAGSRLLEGDTSHREGLDEGLSRPRHCRLSPLRCGPRCERLGKDVALTPIADAIEANLGRRPTQLSADAGYCSDANLAALEGRGIDAYVAPGRAKHASAGEGGGARIAAMREKIKAGGHGSPYRLRKQLPEPVFGQIKQARGFCQFLLRGVEKVAAEWGCPDRPGQSGQEAIPVWFNPSRMHIWTRLEPSAIGKTGYGVYPDGMVEQDGQVGQLLKKLDDLGIAKDTIVIYTSDNGAEVFSWPTAAPRHSGARRIPTGRAPIERRRWCAGFGVSIASAVRWVTRYNTGQISPSPSGGDRRSGRIEGSATICSA